MGQSEKAEVRTPGRWLRRAAVSTLAVGTAGFCLGFVHSFFAHSYTFTSRMSDDSMAPAHPRGEVFYAETITGDEVRHGDVIGFDVTVEHPDGGSTVGRVVALGGETLAYRSGEAHLTLNGKVLAEPYVDHAVVSGGSADFEVKVPGGRLIVLADTRTSPVSDQFEPEEGAAATETGTFPLSAVQYRVVGTEGDPTTARVAGEVALFGGPVLIVVSGALACASRVVRRRAERAVVHPWS
ncbi:signal peptidase I [Streptomyces sp. Isolate_45]|uniref:signal peptidase I n=1 Tax=Streptomyces sp. Isolate_45 TaxID=2950111 RepID=UPI002482039D|nr:signal peptidase I [Streptomyces sp. Isolate_45]MDA5282774.1 signal peptidase I [Streptomyces sp. Isolate_45]